MTKEEQIANFLYHNPKSTVSMIAEMALVGDSQASNLLSKLVTRGIAIREKSNKASLYSAAPDFEPTEIIDDRISNLRNEEIAKIEAKIEYLERHNLWRRAITELTNLIALQQNAVGVAIIAQRRNRCRSNLKS